MQSLPFLFDAEEAIKYLLANQTSDAEKAFAIGLMSHSGLTNKMMRNALNIDHVYTVTHYKRAGTLLSEEELTLWHNNPKRITLGHVRAVARLSRNRRETLLRDLLIKKKSVQMFEAIANNKELNKVQNSDVQRYADLLGEHLGRNTHIDFNTRKKIGSITFDFFSLADLDNLAMKLGFHYES